MTIGIYQSPMTSRPVRDKRQMYEFRFFKTNRCIIVTIYSAISDGVKTWFGWGLDLLYPPSCVICGEMLGDDRPEDLNFCRRCMVLVIPDRKRFCPACGSFHASPDDANFSPDLHKRFPNSCSRCANETFAYTKVIPLGEYRDDLRNAILRMKTDKSGYIASSMASMLFHVRREQLESLDADFIVPVPMHFYRRISRGVNNTEFLAARLGQLLRKPVFRSHVRRIKPTKHQFHLKPDERRRNVKNAFEIRHGIFEKLIGRYVSRHVNGKMILLVDDILTTGCTCNEIAKQYLLAGASSVFVCVIAKSLVMKLP